MDTKLKRFNDNMAVRTLAFIMCVMLFVATLIGGLTAILCFDQAGRSFTVEELFESKSYLESADLQMEFENQANDLREFVCYYKSEENIKAGKLLKETDGVPEEALTRLFYEGVYYSGSEEIKANAFEWRGNTTAYDNGGNYQENNIQNGEYVVQEEDMDFEDNPELRAAFVAANKEPIEKIKSILIKEDLRAFQKLKDSIDAQKGMLYFVSNGKDVYTNIENYSNKNQLNEDGTTAITVPQKGVFEANPAYMMYEEGKLIKVPASGGISASWARYVDNSIEESLFSQYQDDLKVYMAFNQDYIAEKQAAYEETSGVVALLPWIVLCALGCIILFLYLIITTGRRDEAGCVKLYGIDKIWTELQLFIIVAAASLGFVPVAIGVNSSYSNNYYATSLDYEYGTVTSISNANNYVGITDMQMIAIGGICAVLAVIGLWFILSCVRLLKARCFIKNSLIYKLWHMLFYRWISALCRKLKIIFTGSSLMRKAIICALSICLMSATVFLAPIVFLFIIVFMPRWVKRFEEIKMGVEEVKNGNLTHEIPVVGDGELDKLARNINDISHASSLAVQQELRNQRLKTELISNVSHDLKTPLTSMVTYIDLLKTEGLGSENAPEYLRILDEKTERLCHLTEDLFEAAKASSGAMPVHLEKIELLSLIHQGLGEMDKKVKASGLEFIINAQKEKYYVIADGQLLWRVVENLLGNVLKYALENSRVYIDIKQHGGSPERKSEGRTAITLVTLEMKNISRHPLNISADELMERFKRGDESRTTEGSGLGLAIAKDLVKLQNGWFEIFVDGDLFKVQVMLDEAKDDEQEI